MYLSVKKIKLLNDYNLELTFKKAKTRVKILLISPKNRIAPRCRKKKADHSARPLRFCGAFT